MHISIQTLLLILQLALQITTTSSQNSRTSDQQSCERLGAPKTAGAPVGCSWNVDVLERSYFANECEPSQLWLDIAASNETETPDDEFTIGPFACSGRSASECRFDEDSRCLLREDKTNGTIIQCYTPPLELLRDMLGRFVLTVPRIFDLIEGGAQRCVEKVFNTTCSDLPECSWSPEYPAQVSLTELRPSDNYTGEVQTLSVLYPDLESQPEIQSISVIGGESNPLIATITTMVARDNTLIGGHFKLGLQHSSSIVTREVAFNASAAVIQAAINEDLAVVLGDGAITSTVSLLGPDQQNRRMWTVEFSGRFNDGEAPELFATNADLTYLNERIDPDASQVVVSLHGRNTQRITLLANDTIADGSFRIVVTDPSYSSSSSSLLRQETNPIHVVEGEAQVMAGQIAEALLALRLNGLPMLELVFVSTIDVEASQMVFEDEENESDLSELIMEKNPFFEIPWFDAPAAAVAFDTRNNTIGINSNNTELLVSYEWEIVFTTTVKRFELSEFPLEIIWTGNGCIGCTPFRSTSDRGPTSSPSVLPSLSPSFTPSVSGAPTISNTTSNTTQPSGTPSLFPTLNPTFLPTFTPTITPTDNSTLLPTQTPSTPPSNAPVVSGRRLDTVNVEESQMVVDFEVTTSVSAPRVHGYFLLESCDFDTYLPGLVRAQVGSPILETTCDVNGTVSPGSTIKVAGQQFVVLTVSLIDIGSMGTCLDQEYQGSRLTLDGKFEGFERYGELVPELDALLCTYGTTSVNVAYDLNDEALRERINVLTGMDVIVKGATKSEKQDYTWLITFKNVDGEITSREQVSLLRWRQLDESSPTLLGGMGGSTVEIERIQRGEAQPSGVFRLAFAGYDGNETDLFPLRREHADAGLTSSNKDGTLAVKTETGKVQSISYTDEIDVDAGPGGLADALKQLPNLITDGVSVSRSFVNLTSAQGDLWYGIEWRVAFDTDIPGATKQLLLQDLEDLQELDADVPLLGLFSTRLVYGTGVRVLAGTVEQGVGSLVRTATTVEQSSKTDSACAPDDTTRRNSLRTLGLSEDKLTALLELDDIILRCSMSGVDASRSALPTEQDCHATSLASEDEGVTVVPTAAPTITGFISSTTAPTGSIAAASPLCVWRGEDILTSKLFEVPNNIGNIDVATAQALVDHAGLYGGNSSWAHLSPCTVPLMYVGQQLVKIFSLSEEQKAAILLNQTNTVDGDVADEGTVTNVTTNGILAEGLLVLLNKFRGCASDDLLELRFPDTKFFVVWQFVVTFTSYTCALAYGAGGGWLAYRMGRVRLSFAGVGATVLIVFCSLMLGGVIGFVAGCLPAALLSQIYASIPHNLSNGSAISLGISMGLVILYFDLGRGSDSRRS